MLGDPKLLALATAAFFGLNPVVLKRGFASTARVDTAVFLGLAVAVPLYVALLPLAGGLHWEQVTPSALAGFILGGLFGAGIGRGWLFLAIQRIGASRATAIKNAAPLFTTVLAVVLLGEAVPPVRWAAIVAIVLGLVVLGWKSGEAPSHLHRVGVLAALGSALSYGVRPLFLKLGLEAADLPLTAALVGAIAALGPYALTLARRKGLLGRDVPAASLRLFVAAGVLQSLGFLALTVALAGESVSVVYPITATAPLFTLVFSRFMLRTAERLSPRDLLGIFATVGGVIVLSR